MSKEANENKLYRFLDRFQDGISGTYRQLEEQLGIDHVTIMRIVKECNDISYKVHGLGNNKETFWILKKYETKTNSVISKKNGRFAIQNETNKSFKNTSYHHVYFEEPIPTVEITFNTRQHRLCDYLLKNCLGKENKVDKVDLLWDLKEYYFDEDTSFDPSNLFAITKEMIKKSRYNYSEHTRLTNDLSFINRHGEIRQILIGSKSGIDNGVWALRVGEQHDVIDRKFGDALKIYKTAWRMKKTAEKQGNYKLVFKNEKELLDVLRQFDQEDVQL